MGNYFFPVAVITIIRLPKSSKLKLRNWDEIPEKIGTAWANLEEGEGQIRGKTCLTHQSLRAPRVVWCSWIALYHLSFCKFFPIVCVTFTNHWYEGWKAKAYKVFFCYFCASEVFQEFHFELCLKTYFLKVVSEFVIWH